MAASCVDDYSHPVAFIRGRAMELPKTIAGLDARKVREMFKDLMKRETEYTWKDGVPSVVIRRVTPELIAASLHASTEAAERIQVELVSEGWIEPAKFVPSTRGMALAQHVDRPRLTRAEAEGILDKALEWADRTNADPEARVKIKSIDLFGSLLRDQNDVGDVDLFVEFTTMDLGTDLESEDLAREDELGAELVAISEYISPSSDLDRMIMDVPSQRIFPTSRMAS
jgi:predicted nucleotidyltransferase